MWNQSCTYHNITELGGGTVLLFLPGRMALTTLFLFPVMRIFSCRQTPVQVGLQALHTRHNASMGFESISCGIRSRWVVHQPNTRPSQTSSWSKRQWPQLAVVVACGSYVIYMCTFTHTFTQSSVVNPGQQLLYGCALLELRSKGNSPARIIDPASLLVPVLYPHQSSVCEASCHEKR